MTSPASDLQKEYAIRFSQMADYRNSVWKIIIDEFLQKRVGENKVILDLGSGWGEFINNIRAATKYAMDLNPESKSKVSSGVTFLEQDCSETWGLPDDSLDVVFTSNFFEHLPTKSCLLDTLQQAKRCLKPSGKIICLGPNIKYTGDDYWDFFDHYLPLSHLSLAEGLRMADLEVAEMIPKFLPYTMAGGRKWPLIFLSLYLKSPIAWRTFGKQFLITATKP